MASIGSAFASQHSLFAIEPYQMFKKPEEEAIAQEQDFGDQDALPFGDFHSEAPAPSEERLAPPSFHQASSHHEFSEAPSPTDYTRESPVSDSSYEYKEQCQQQVEPSVPAYRQGFQGAFPPSAYPAAYLF